MTVDTQPTRQDILTQGKFKKTVYGISKSFEWRVYIHKNEQYQISMFSDEVVHVKRIYCECCGRKFLPSMMRILYGLNTCVSCVKNS